MTKPFEASIVRLRTADGSIVGAGFLVADRRVLTCTHVVADALGIPGDTGGEPGGTLHLDFPLIVPGDIRIARVILWQIEKDVAGLELNADLPAGAQPVCLVTTKDFWLHPFRAFGFPTGYDDGVWVSGVLRGRQATGWVQIEDVKEPGYWVQPGFSGTPVWDEQLHGVVGMAVAADIQPGIKAAFMIPARSLIEAWPDLTLRSLDVNDLVYLEEQLAVLETAQRNASDPRRFQPRIDELRAVISNWEGRVEQQRQRIAESLEERRQQIVESSQRRDEKHLRVIGRRPLDVTDYFKDRRRELMTIGELLAQPTTRLVSVIGHGGMGKTALACKVLRDLERHRWPHTDDEIPLDGIVYLSTRTTGISLERLFLDCAKLVGGEVEKRLNAIWTNPEIQIEDKVSHLLEALKVGRYVILLDNIEDLLNGQGQLLEGDLRLFFDQCLTTSHGARLLVTSRAALAFLREVMRFDQQVKLLEGLPISDGVALLRELDPNGEYGLRDAVEQQLAQAVSLVHGVPRALEVLAGILANDPFSSLAEVLEGFYEQEDVVQALIEENYKRLDGDARRVIEALAVFRRPVPLLAVDYLLEPFIPGLDVPGIIRRLARTNIVSVDRAAKTVTLHPIDQDYAYSQLPEEEANRHDHNRQALERRAADYYFQLRTPPNTWKTIDDLEPQLTQFEHRIRAGDFDEACQVLDPIDTNYLYRWGHFTRLVGLRERLLGRLKAPVLRANNLLGLGRAYHELGRFERAVNLYGKALAITREINNCEAEVGALGALGRVYRILGEVGRAIAFYEGALALAQEIGDRRGESGALGNLGAAYCDLGQVKQAVKSLEDALSITREIGIRHQEGVWLGHLGIAHHNLGRFGQAIALYEQALDIVHEIGERRIESAWLGNLAFTYQALGQFEQAIKLWENSLNIAHEIGYRLGESYSSLRLGQALLSVGSLSEARQHCNEACKLDMPETSHRAALALGIVLLHQHDPAARGTFADATARSRARLEKTPDLYESRYALAAALVGQAGCDPRWAKGNERAELLAPALAEYRRALEICAAPGVVQDALRDLELIRAAGIEGLEPIFGLLQGAEATNEH
jgi:tetratricopeptide (TPR) repeat protein